MHFSFICLNKTQQKEIRESRLYKPLCSPLWRCPCAAPCIFSSQYAVVIRSSPGVTPDWNISSLIPFHLLTGERRGLSLCTLGSYKTSQDNIWESPGTVNQTTHMFRLPFTRNWIWVCLVCHTDYKTTLRNYCLCLQRGTRLRVKVTWFNQM